MGNDTTEDFFKWLEDLIEPVRQQIENIIANNPQAYVDSVERFFDFITASIESYKPIAVQNARIYAMTLREQKKIYYSSLQYENPYPIGTYQYAYFEIYIKPLFRKKT